MSSNIDFKALWQQQPAAAKPNVEELITKAQRLTRKAKRKQIRVNIMLASTIVLVIAVGYSLNTHVLTTTVGIGIEVISMIYFLVVSNSLYLNLFKPHPEADTYTYLVELISIQKKQEFIQTKVMRLYFIILNIGLFLYLLEPAQKLKSWHGIIIYVVLFAWMSFVYFYMLPRKFKKQQAEMNTTIATLQAINEQLENTKKME
jgi:Ca2+/Na+ antiporter